MDSNYFIDDGLPYPYVRLMFRLIDITIIGCLFLFCGIIITKIVEYLMPKFDLEKYKKKNILLIFIELCFYVGIISVTHYFIRKITKSNFLRFFDGLYGYENKRVWEARRGFILVIGIMTFHIQFLQKLKYFVNDRIHLLSI